VFLIEPIEKELFSRISEPSHGKKKGRHVEGKYYDLSMLERRTPDIRCGGDRRALCGAKLTFAQSA